MLEINILCLQAPAIPYTSETIVFAKYFFLLSKLEHVDFLNLFRDSVWVSLEVRVLQQTEALSISLHPPTTCLSSFLQLQKYISGIDFLPTATRAGYCSFRSWSPPPPLLALPHLFFLLKSFTINALFVFETIYIPRGLGLVCKGRVKQSHLFIFFLVEKVVCPLLVIASANSALCCWPLRLLVPWFLKRLLKTPSHSPQGKSDLQFHKILCPFSQGTSVSGSS